MQPVAPRVDPARVRRGFDRLAPRYASEDFLAREIARRMDERLDYVKLAPRRVLDLGCGCGGDFAALAARYPQARLVGCDRSAAMLAAGRKPATGLARWLPFLSAPAPALCAADAAALPFPDASFDLVWSNLLLHWLDDPLPALAEARRVLAEGGLLMFATLGPDTFSELRAAAGAAPRVHAFADMHDLGDMLVAAGFADPVMDMEMLTLTYDSVDALLGELRRASIGNALAARPRGLSGKRWLASLRTAYERHRRDGRLPASIEIVYGHAWKAAPKQGEKPAQGGARPLRFMPRRSA